MLENSIDDQEIIRLYESGLSLKQIGKKFSKGRHTISRILKRNNILVKRKPKYTIPYSELYQLYMVQELSSRMIAKRYNIPDHKTITRIMNEFGIPLRSRNEYTNRRRKVISIKRKKFLSEDPSKNPMKNPITVAKYKDTLKRTGIRKGSKNPSWKGGITPEIRKIRNSPETDVWRQSVFVRDSYSCQMCGNPDRQILEAHHIKLFKDNVALRFNLINGITLCTNCHQAIYGKERYIEKYFIKLIKGKKLSNEQLISIREKIMSKVYLYRNSEWLNNNYLVIKRSIEDIASECKVDKGTIYAWLDRFNIALRKNTFSNDDLIQDYQNGFSFEKLQRKYKIGPNRIKDLLLEYGVSMRHIERIKKLKEKYMLIKIAYNKGMSKRQIKKTYSTGYSTINKALRKE